MTLDLDKATETINKVISDMGFVIFSDNSDNDDINLQDFIIDSIQFIDFIVRIESEISTTLSDDFLDYDLLISSQAFGNKLYEYLSEQ